MKFTLTITLGNEAMQTTRDVLNAVTGSLVRAGLEYTQTLKHDDMGGVFDDNGNRVGQWEVTESD